MKRPALCLALLLATVVQAKKVHAPLPDALINAKSVYIDNQSRPKILDRAYAELKKWGRYTVVQNSADADIVLVLRVVDTGSSVHSGSANGSSWTDSQGHTYAYASGGGSTNEVYAPHIDIVDRKTNTQLWIDSRVPGNWRWSKGDSGLVAEMIQDWRKRTEEQTAK